VDGAEIVEATSQKNPLKMDFGSDHILIKEPGKFAVKAKIRTNQSSIKFYLVKDPLGLASVEINGIGTLADYSLPLKVPLRIKTNSSFSKISFFGAKILSANIDDNSRTAIYSVTNDSMLLNNLRRANLNLNFSANLSSQEAFPTILLEKGNEGGLQVNLGEFIYYNNHTGNRTLKNLIITVEMTSNRSQIFFDGGRIVKGKLLQSDEQNLEESIVGQDFIYLKYSHGGDQFRRAKYLLDLDLSKNSKLVIYKNNTGFVNVRIGSNNYFVTDFSESLPYLSRAFEFKNITQETHEAISIPISIKTSSDWTEVRFNGLEGAALDIGKADGDIELPATAGGSISLRKRSLSDLGLVRLNLTLRADNQDKPSITIEKGDIGATEVNVGNLFVINNSQKINGNPRNSITYPIPQLPATADFIELNNPAAYIIPFYALTDKGGMENKIGSAENPMIILSSDDLPGWRITMRDSVANGLIAYIFLSYMILILFWLLELGKEGYFQELWSERISARSFGAFAVTKFEDAPISSIIIFEALISLAVTPFLLLFSENLANAAAILAYLFLVAGVVARFLEMKSILILSRQNELILKVEFVAILMAAGYIGTFEMVRSEQIPAPFGILGIIAATAVFVLVLFTYLKRLYSSRKGT